MNTYYEFLKKGLLLSSLVIGQFGFANFPYEGNTEECNLAIVKPGAGGAVASHSSDYLTDKSCKTVFVLPPRNGIARFDSYNILAESNLCSSYTTSLNRVKNLVETQRDLESRIATLTDSEMNILTYINKALPQAKMEKDQFSKMVIFEGKAHFEHEWTELVNAYREANTGRGLTIKKMPLVANALSVRLKSEDDLIGLSSTGALHSFNVPGVKLSSLENISERIGYAAAESENTFAMGESLTGFIQLNMSGVCPIVNILKKKNGEAFTLDSAKREALNSNLSTYLVANSTIWYPVELSKKYSVKVKVDKVINELNKLTKTKNTFKVSEVVDLFESSNLDQSIDITIQDEDSAGTSGELYEEIQDLKGLILDDIVLKLISTIATPTDSKLIIKDLDIPNDPHIKQTRTQRICRTKRSFFRKSRKCWDQSYTVKVAVEGRGELIQTSAKNFAYSYNEKSELIKTVLRITTMGFVKESK